MSNVDWWLEEAEANQVGTPEPTPRVYKVKRKGSNVLRAKAGKLRRAALMKNARKAVGLK
jgi:hypothetical protein